MCSEDPQGLGPVQGRELDITPGLLSGDTGRKPPAIRALARKDEGSTASGPKAKVVIGAEKLSIHAYWTIKAVYIS